MCACARSGARPRALAPERLLVSCVRARDGLAPNTIMPDFLGTRGRRQNGDGDATTMIGQEIHTALVIATIWGIFAVLILSMLRLGEFVIAFVDDFF